MAPHAAAGGKENPPPLLAGVPKLKSETRFSINLYVQIFCRLHIIFICLLHHSDLFGGACPLGLVGSSFIVAEVPTHFLTFRLGAPYHIGYRMYDTRPVGACMAVVYHIAGLWGILPPRRCARRSRRVAVPRYSAKYARPAGRLRKLRRLGSLANSYWYQGNQAPGYAAKLR